MEIQAAAFAGVAEWQTRWTQNPVAFGLCGFKSHLRYLDRIFDFRANADDAGNGLVDFGLGRGPSETEAQRTGDDFVG